MTLKGFLLMVVFILSSKIPFSVVWKQVFFPSLGKIFLCMTGST